MQSIGLMSGTSMDGIDAALLDTDGENVIIEGAQYSISYPPEMKIVLKAAEYAMKSAKGAFNTACEHFPLALERYLSEELQYKGLQNATQSINTYFTSILNLSSDANHLTLPNVIELSTRLHYDAIIQLLTKTNCSLKEIDCIGYHGQTLYHQPLHKKTIQISDGALLAKLTGVKVINDFRSNDIALGGQGAPFAPLYHQALARRDHLIPMAVINCGGIANITLIFGKEIDEVMGFDTGPGNCLIDAWVKKNTHGQEFMDKDGQYAKQGVVHNEILKKLLTESIRINNVSYFQMPPPKSLDIQDITFIPEMNTLSLNDACATLAAFTAESIIQGVAYLNLRPEQIPKLFVLAGGGAYNPVIKQELTTRFQTTFDLNIEVKHANDLHWHNQAIEAQLIAYFAVRSIKNLPLSMPRTTGVPYPTSGGTLHIPPKNSNL